MKNVTKKRIPLYSVVRRFNPHWGQKELFEFLIRQKFIESLEVGIGDVLSEDRFRYANFQLGGCACNNPIEIHEDLVPLIEEALLKEQDECEYEENLKIEFSWRTEEYEKNMERINSLSAFIEADYSTKKARLVREGLKL